MRIFKPKGFQWLLPLLVLASGVINLTNPSLSDSLKTVWWVFIPILIIVVIIGVINHYKLLKSGKALK
jgi:hypothetical protein